MKKLAIILLALLLALPAYGEEKTLPSGYVLVSTATQELAARENELYGLQLAKENGDTVVSDGAGDSLVIDSGEASAETAPATAGVPIDTAIANAEAARQNAQQALDAAINSKGDLTQRQAEVDAAQAKVDELKAQIQQNQAKIENLQSIADELAQAMGTNEAYEKAKAAYLEAYDSYLSLRETLDQKIASDNRSAALNGVDLNDLAQQIEIAKQKLDELTGGEENQITAKVSGVVQSVSCTAGDTKAKDDVLCTIEVPDMGYNLSFSVTNEQARRLKPGDSATVSNFYWGGQIVATLSTITVDPKNPNTNKLLTFDVTGDVNSGSELTVSVGQKSANYDVIIPNSSIRSDSNGSFVLAVDQRSSPLGNRYVARRVAVEVLAEDDLNSAVTGDLSYGDYVITTSNAPVKNGDMVRLADNS